MQSGVRSFLENGLASSAAHSYRSHMSTLAEIKTATSSLSVDEQLELAEWIRESELVQARELAELRRNLDIGIEQADRGELMSSAEVFAKLRTRIADIAKA